MIPKGWKKIIIPVQHMFPNCQVKYKTKCTDMKECDKDKEYWDNLNAKTKDGREYKLQQFRTKQLKLKPTKPPKEFQDDIQRAKKVKFE